MEPISKIGSIKVFLPRNQNFAGGFRLRGGKNFRGFAGNNQNIFGKGSSFTNSTGYGPRFRSNYPR